MSPTDQAVTPDAHKTHWVYKMPVSWQPYLQLSRLDRPIGYWLLALPGWIGIAFARLVTPYTPSDIWLAALILIGAIAMRGAGCTYNDIVDQDLDAQVARTALRPLPSGRVSNKQAWAWLMAQCGIGLVVLLLLPNRLAQIISLCAIPLVAAYPFMKRITWWPQIWLGLTFNWAILVAYAALVGQITPPLLLLYLGLVFWTVGYDTVYACQDMEDDALIGVKSTARRFGRHIKPAIMICYSLFLICALFAVAYEYASLAMPGITGHILYRFERTQMLEPALVLFIGLWVYALWQMNKFNVTNSRQALRLFKAAATYAIILIIGFALLGFLYRLN